MSNTPEGKIKRWLDKSLKELDVWFYSPQSGPFGKAGIPDRVAIVKGRFVGIECKADKNKKPTALQTKTMKEIEMNGGKCFLVYDKETIQEVITYIKGTKMAFAGLKKEKDRASVILYMNANSDSPLDLP